jgi:P4 family phage/plasmid primase-like protien
MTAPAGARLEDWQHFADWLNLGEDLLPVVPDEHATPSPLSKVKKFGKIPSLYNSEGQARGIADWTTLPINKGNVAHWSADRRYSLCLRLGAHSGCYAIDVDVDDYELCEEIENIIRASRPSDAQPMPVRSRAGALKFLLLFRLTEPLSKVIIDWGRKDAAGKPERIEILGEGQQCVVAGSHPSGALYEWNDTDNVPWVIPTLTRSELDAIIAALAKRFGTSSLTKSAIAPGSSSGVASSATGEEVLSSISAEELADLEDALRYQPLVAEAASNDFWSECGYALLSLGEQGRLLWVEFSQRAPNRENADDPLDWWNAHEHQTPRSDFRHLFSLARALGWRSHSSPGSFGILPDVSDRSATVADILRDHPQAVADPQIPLAQFLCTDLANARRVVVSFGKKLAVVAGTFYGYSGTHWEKDESGAARCIARLSEVIRGEAQAYKEQFDALVAASPDYKQLVDAYVDQPRRTQSVATRNLRMTELGPQIIKAYETYDELRRWAKSSESAAAQNAATKLLRSMLETNITKLDTHHYLLNCLNGTVDLRTGEIREHRPEDWITQLAPTNYNPAAECRGFEQFLVDILDEERAGFLKRWSGYCATGDTREQKIVLHIGPGGNGKGTFFRIITAALGSYVHTAAPHILTGDAGSSRHPTEIADLFGRRFVVSHESDEGAVLREGFMKQASGEDQLSGRLLFKDFFSFTPTFKLQLLTNHRPIVKGSDFGVWRRLLLLDYNVRYGSAEQVQAGDADKLGDEGLTTKLMAEREGVLAWIVQGAMEWYRNGLQAPVSIFEASAAYRNEQDRAKQFVAERCIVDRHSWSPFSGPFGLYPEYARWCKDSGFQALTSTRFIGELQRVVGAGFRRGQKDVKIDNVYKNHRGCWGLRINVDQDGGGFAVLPDADCGDLL